MKAGTLRHRVTLQVETRTPDGQGGNVATWSDWQTVWASVDPASAHKQWLHDQLQHQVSHTIRMRYHAGVKPDMRVKYGSRIFQIQGIRDPEERKRELSLDCLEIPAGAST